MKIGVVVHGPEIVDSGFALKILKLMEDYGEVQARLGGTMGRTAVIDSNLENIIDITQKLLPSQSVDRFNQEDADLILLINYGKSSITGHAFGFKVFNHCPSNTPLLQIERPGEKDGSVVAWREDLQKMAKDLAERMNLRIVSAQSITEFIVSSDPCQKESERICRKIAGVSPGENIFVNGIVVGRSISEEVALVAENGIIAELIGGKLKVHGVEKLGPVDLEHAIVKTGLLRKSRVKPRVLKSKKTRPHLSVSYLNHAAEDIYRLRDADMVVTVGDDTTLVAADILYRFNVPIIGITDGDLDKVVEEGFKAEGSLVVELESGLDDIIGEKIFMELFQSRETIEIENMENFKSKILQIIKKTTPHYLVKYN
ncbi:MAG TPA: DUF2117 domain-containing protein [Methanobacteriaceae archaeon]|nr:DUF2117 domain-containing protein [Methanobacteriaceae archaeon]